MTKSRLLQKILKSVINNDPLLRSIVAMCSLLLWQEKLFYYLKIVVKYIADYQNNEMKRTNPSGHSNSFCSKYHKSCHQYFICFAPGLWIFSSNALSRHRSSPHQRCYLRPASEHAQCADRPGSSRTRENLWKFWLVGAPLHFANCARIRNWLTRCSAEEASIRNCLSRFVAQFLS